MQLFFDFALALRDKLGLDLLHVMQALRPFPVLEAQDAAEAAQAAADEAQAAADDAQSAADTAQDAADVAEAESDAALDEAAINREVTDEVETAVRGLLGIPRDR